jgi:NAD(P)-dependent dehydrogenase (short-subunit alcohol dehydrogenase family)
MPSGPSRRRVLVTGGSGGIGQSIVRRFAAGGAHVVNLDLAPSRSRARPRGRVDFVPVDLSDVTAIRRAFADSDALFGGRPPDVLVCAAAIGMTHHLLEVQPEDVDRVMGVNVRGTLFCCQEAALRMRDRGAGHIVIVTSISAVQGWSQEPLYCISKAAQASLVQSLAVELAPFGVLVNGIGPGVIDVKSRGMSGNRARPEILQHYVDRIPIGRMGSPGEVAESIWYLSGVTYMTGQTLYMDGGFLVAGLGYIGSLRDSVLARLDKNLPRRTRRKTG